MDSIESGELLREIKAARTGIEARDGKTAKRVEELERAINELFARQGRPGGDGFGELGGERKDARQWLIEKHALDRPRDDGLAPFWEPSSAEIDGALVARKALEKFFRSGDARKLDHLETKALSSFTMNEGWILPPQMASRILSCLVDPSDITGLVSNETISASATEYPIDNVDAEEANWACQADCFHNNPSDWLKNGLGTLTIKPEPLRFVVCAGSDLLEDASFNVETWLFRKVSRGFQKALNRAIVTGDGIGRPQGILNPASGIPVCDVSTHTTAGQFDWRDLIALAFEVPQQYHPGAVYMMNQRTAGLAATMSDATGRPLMQALPGEMPPDLGRRGGLRALFTIAGWPVLINNWMPNVAPGNCPVFFGNLSETYMLITRKAVTTMRDPYSYGYCVGYRFESRVNGAILCPGAARLLRVK
jgi:HK97 family phage major capsid protein